MSGTPVGKADLIMNEMSNRATPTMVSFHERERSVGEAAQGQLGVNPQNTVTHVSNEAPFGPTRFMLLYSLWVLALWLPLPLSTVTASPHRWKGHEGA